MNENDSIEMIAWFLRDQAAPENEGDPYWNEGWVRLETLETFSRSNDVSSHIADLRKRGYNIEEKVVHGADKKVYLFYRLKETL